MATIRLIPSSYTLSSSTLSITDAANMYDNTDSTTYATIANIPPSTYSYYLYISGFNFDALPAGTVVNSFSIKLKGYGTGMTTSYYVPKVLSNPSTSANQLGSFSSLTTSAQILTASMSADWATVSAAGSNLSIQIDLKHKDRDVVAYAYIYGAEIYVDCTLPETCSITSSLTGDGTISPSGAYMTYEGAEYTLTITPTDTSDPVVVKKDGVDVSSSLVPHYAEPSGSASTVLGAYTLVSGDFHNGEGYFSGIVGNGVYAEQTADDYYAYGGSGSTVVFTYSMAFTNIPSNATITRVYCEVNGHAESTTEEDEYMCVQLKSGSTALSAQLNFKDIGTSNTTQTLECTTIPTAEQLRSMVLECTLGYYGGAINGATCYVVYETPVSDNPEYYTYSFTVDGDATIAVVIGIQDAIYFKDNGSWVEATAVYKKVGGSWVLQSDLTAAFDSNTNYVRG